MKNSTGWVKLYRKLNDTSFKNKPLTVALFVDLLTNANHQKRVFIHGTQTISIEAGQLVTGLYQLSERTGISPQSIRTALVTLKSTNTITIKTTNKFSIITILKWEDYQETPTSNLTSQLTINQQTTNKQLTTNNNVKNDKNINTIAKPLSETDVSAMIKKEVDTIEKSERIRTEYQHLGLEIWDQLKAPPDKKGEFIRIVRDCPRPIVDAAFSFARDYPVTAIRWKMFFKRYWSLIKSKQDAVPL